MLVEFCKHCSKVYTPKTPRQKHCSDSCRNSDHSNRYHYFPKYGSYAKVAYNIRKRRKDITQLKEDIRGEKEITEK